MKVEPLKKIDNWKARKGPVVLVIMDGCGCGCDKPDEGNAFKHAVKDTINELVISSPLTRLKAHGFAVGLATDDEMGNSEVGHNAIGCGRIISQGSKLVNDSIETNSMFTGETWKKLIENVKKSGGTLHFLGLLSDGGVHGNIHHLESMLIKAKEAGVKVVRVHALLDGRDVGETSALDFFDPFDTYLKKLSTDGFDAKIASGGGRMKITMDRYNADWPMVEKGWKTHVLGEGRGFSNAHEAIETLRKETGAIDQNLDPFIITENGKPIGPIVDGDSVILFNYRGDRAIEISRAFDEKNFTMFNRIRHPKVEYAGIMQYDGDLKIPQNYLVTPPHIDCTMAEYLCKMGIKQFSISETQKYGHITFFFNGNKSGKFNESLEEYVEIQGDNVPFDQRPAMKCAQITDKVIAAIESKKFGFIKINYPNGDMVGHTGNYQAAVCSVEAMDLCIGRLKDSLKQVGGILVLTADHGNCDEMYERDKNDKVIIKPNGKPKAKTCHSLNPVPFIIFDPDYSNEYDLELKKGLGLTSVAATCFNLMGYQVPEGYNESIIKLKTS